MSAQIQELCESIVMNALSASPALSTVIRHDDASPRVTKNMISVKAEAPEPRLEGERGYRVEVTAEIKSATATANAATYAEALARLTSATALGVAAAAAGLTSNDDLTILDEEISGGRDETKNLRKRTITLPFVIGIYVSPGTPVLNEDGTPVLNEDDTPVLNEA